MVRMPGSSLTGRLIVATPDLEDPNFRRAVVLLLEHGPEGAVGVVLDRPLDLTVAEALPSWSDYAAAPPVLFAGGPVEQDAAIALGRLRHPCVDPAPFGRSVAGDLVTVNVSVPVRNVMLLGLFLDQALLGNTLRTSATMARESP